MRLVLATRGYRRFWHNSSLVFMLLMLSACTGLTGLVSDPELQVEELVARQEYSQALAIIAAIDQSHPQYALLQNKRQAILKRIKSYEKTVLRTAIKLQGKAQWAQAVSAIDAALEKISSSKELSARRKKIIQERNHYVEQWSLSLAILRAKSLPEEQVLLTKINQAYSADSQNGEMDTIRNQVNESRARLLSEAKDSIDKQRWSKAYDYIQLADLLRRDRESIKLRKDIETRIKSLEIKQLAQAIEDNELVKAQAIVSGMAGFKHDQEVLRLSKQLDDKIASAVKLLTEVGQKYYIEGQLDRAIDNWQQALTLNLANSDLEKRLLRAQLFKSNYQKFQTTQ